jgi:hypothetical protein
MGRWARISSWGMGEEVGAAGTQFRMSIADFFHAFGSWMDDVESGRSIGGGGGTDGVEFRCWRHEEEVGAAGTQFACP